MDNGLDFDYNQLVVLLKKFNDDHPEYVGYAFIKIYDDGTGGIYFRYDEDRIKLVAEFSELFVKYS